MGVPEARRTWTTPAFELTVPCNSLDWSPTGVCRVSWTSLPHVDHPPPVSEDRHRVRSDPRYGQGREAAGIFGHFHLF